jgi:hypothetical protein
MSDTDKLNEIRDVVSQWRSGMWDSNHEAMREISFILDREPGREEPS